MTSAQLDVYKEWLGIPEGPRPPDHYALLRLKQFEDDDERIRKNYKKLNAEVRKYATGKYSIQSQDLLNELAKAMLCLTDRERKRDYDESLGREFADEGEQLGRKPLLRSLVESGAFTREQAREAEQFAEARGLTQRDAVVQMKLADAETATRAYARELGLPYADLADMLPEDSALDRVPKQIVKRNSILPLFADGDVQLVACADEPGAELEDDLRLRYGMPVRFVLAAPRAIQQAIAKYYAPGVRDDAGAAAAIPAPGRGEKTAAGDAPRTAAMSPAERQHRKQIGWIVMCWGVILPVLVDRFVLKLGPIWRMPWWPKFLPFFLAFFIPPIVIWYVVNIYWKERR